MDNAIKDLKAARDTWARMFMLATTEATADRAEAEIAKLDKAIERAQAQN